MDTLKIKHKVNITLKDFCIKPEVCQFSLYWNIPTVPVKLLELVKVWAPFRPIFLFKSVTSYGHWTDSSFFWASDRKVQGVLPLRMCTVYHSNVIMPGWFYQKTSLCRKALTRLGQGTALLLGRTAGKAPSVVQLTAVKMVDNTNQFNSNFRNRSDLTSCKASISFFLQMCCFEILFALKIFVLKNISGKLR